MSRSTTWAGVLVLSLCTSLAGATTVLFQDVPALTRTSDAVVRGTVTRQQSRWTGDHRRIVTDVELSVSETLKGTPRSTLVIRQPGGEVGDIGQRVDGLASFKVGEEVLVFLEQQGDGFIVSGLAQGKYRIERSSDGRGIFAVPDPNTHEARVVDPLTHQERVVTPKTWTLDDLRAEVQRSMLPGDESSIAPLPQKANRTPPPSNGSNTVPAPGTPTTTTPKGSK